MRIALRTLRARVATARPLSDIEMTKSVSLSLSEAWIGRPLSVAGPVAVAANVSSRVGSRMTPTVGRPSTTSADRDAEERDAVGVVDGAVERVDDPDPAAPRGGRLARLRRVLPGLLGKDRVGRVARADRVEDERLGQVVRLGHDVAGALVVDLLEPLVVVHQDHAGLARDVARELELVAVGGLGVDRHGEVQSTSNGRTAIPRPVTVSVNVTVAPGSIRGREHERAHPGRPVRRVDQVAGRLARALPLFVTVSVIARPVAVGDRLATVASNGPIPAQRRTARRWRGGRRPAMAPAIAMPWTCEADTSRSPSGLHRSHSPTSSGTGAPQRAQPWVRPAGWSVPRDGATNARSSGRNVPTLPALGSLDQRVDVLGRAGEDDRPVRAGRLPALPLLARRADPRRVGDGRVAEPVALEPDDDRLVLAPPARRLERLEVERQVLLEVVVEGATSRRRSAPPAAPRPASRRR